MYSTIFPRDVIVGHHRFETESCSVFSVATVLPSELSCARLLVHNLCSACFLYFYLTPILCTGTPQLLPPST